MPWVGGVLELVAAWVAVAPDAVAVRCGDVVLSYGQLWRRSGVLAGVLAGAGVGVVVGVSQAGGVRADGVTGAEHAPPPGK